MADSRNLQGILERGLLSTSSLLDLFEIRGAERVAIERKHRPATVPIEHERYGTAMIRDQKPMSVSRIAASLTDAAPDAFFRFLNGRVFFWPTEKRLATMNAARAYREQDQTVFVLASEPLIAEYEKRIRLSPMNSGATTPFAHPRSIGMFKRVNEFDYESRSKYADPIAEVTIDAGVDNIMEFVERIEIWRGGEKIRRLNRPYDLSLLERLSK